MGDFVVLRFADSLLQAVAKDLDRRILAAAPEMMEPAFSEQDKIYAHSLGVNLD